MDSLTCLINGELFCAVIFLLSYILQHQTIQNYQRNDSGHLVAIIILFKLARNLVIIAIKSVSSKADL